MEKRELEIATELVHGYINNKLDVIKITTLSGGMICIVQEWETNGDPSSLVIKYLKEDHDNLLLREYHALKFLKNNTNFPVPKPLGYIKNPGTMHGFFLLMEKISGVTLNKIGLSEKGKDDVDFQLAEFVSGLHDHTNTHYGFINNTVYMSWVSFFRPRMKYWFEKVKGVLKPHECIFVDFIISNLENFLPDDYLPTLIHGDLWKANIMAASDKSGYAKINAFIDCQARYANPEFELAYLLYCKTVGNHFFEEYKKRHMIINGFENRCLIYWLHSTLVHIGHFGNSYLDEARHYIAMIKEKWPQIPL